MWDWAKKQPHREVKNGQHMNVMSEYINFGKINDQKVAVAL